MWVTLVEKLPPRFRPRNGAAGRLFDLSHSLSENRSLIFPENALLPPADRSEHEGCRHRSGVLDPMGFSAELRKRLAGAHFIRGAVVVMVGEGAAHHVDDSRIILVAVQPDMAARGDVHSR